MESKKINQISIDIPNFSGPLEMLLELAKNQKVDLAEISITKLADQFLEFIKDNKDLNLETASEFLLMATWLAYLKSKLLLPESEEDDFKALEVAERLKLQLKKLELIRILSDQMLQKKRLGIDIFTRGMKGGIRSINTPIYDVSLYELLKTYSNIQMQKTFENISIPKLPVFSDEGEILSGSADPDEKYQKCIRPWKSRLGILYIEKSNIVLDFCIIICTAVNIFNRRLALKMLSYFLKQIGAQNDLVQFSLRKGY